MMDIYICRQKADELRQKATVAVSEVESGVKSAFGSITDGALYRTMLVSFGMLIGTAFSKFLKKHKALIACITLASAVLFLYRILSDLDDD
ncbi:MAG: hypothetical protein ACI4PQ_09395 [Butyricicoccaceae bacterium]